MDKALKQRLVGASVLVALAVIVLPMLLGGRPDGTSEVRNIELPPQPAELDFETRRYPIGAQPADDAGEAPEKAVDTLPAPRPLPQVTPAESTISESTTSESPRSESGSEPGSESPPAEAAAEAASEAQGSAPDAAAPDAAAQGGPSVAAPPAGSAGRYVVQVASFGAIENASRLSAALGDYGYGVMTDTVKSDVGTLHRVRVGPYRTEEQAREAATRLQTQVGDVRPRIMDLRPEEGTQVTTPADPMVRWVVQVGSFSRAANAENLVARLRLESLSAFHEEVTAAGSTIHRVRVGPFLEREEAIRVEQRLRDSMALDGVVMSAD